MLFSWTALLALSTFALRGVVSLPVNETVWDGLDNQARDILARATPAAPHWVAYADAYDGTSGPPAVSQIKVRRFVP